MKLVIVESPTKCNTIKKYLGSDFEVVASMGHIRDLSTKGKFGLGVDLNDNFKPDYVTIKGKNKVVTELKKLGADIQETPDGMIINGKCKLLGNCEVETYLDHRLAMSLYVAGLICEQEILINEFEWVNISFPTFEELFNKLI